MRKVVSLEMAASSRSICVFCRARHSVRPAQDTAFQRHFVSSSHWRKPGEAAATRQQDDREVEQQQEQQPTTPQPRQGGFKLLWQTVGRRDEQPLRGRTESSRKPIIREDGGDGQRSRFSSIQQISEEHTTRDEKGPGRARRAMDLHSGISPTPLERAQSKAKEPSYYRAIMSDNEVPGGAPPSQPRDAAYSRPSLSESEMAALINRTRIQSSGSVSQRRNDQFDKYRASRDAPKQPVFEPLDSEDAAGRRDQNFSELEPPSIGPIPDYSRDELPKIRPDRASRFGSVEDYLSTSSARRSKRFEIADNADPLEQAFERRKARWRSMRRFNERDLVEDEYDRRMGHRKERRRKRKEQRQQQTEEARPPVDIPPFISVSNFAALLKVRMEDLVAKLEQLGFEDIAGDHVLNHENASLVAMEYNFEPRTIDERHDDLLPRPPAEDQSALPVRPPVITIMGHVDHGKTTILDYLRKSSVAASEHGGITQHIGAFSVPMASGNTITFLDTPGHAAFLSMRQRGANVTDIVVLVVAADDSVKPQTIEAIKHAKAAGVPVIVAINKVDKAEADVERVKQDLTRYEIVVEDFGGDVQSVAVSGKTGQGMDALENALALQAEVLDMRAEVDGQVEGWILEATTKKSGRVATVLVRRGTLRVGDVIVAGNTWARVRTLRNETGAEVPSASPGTPVEVDGWRDQPTAGDEVLQASDEQKATSVTRYRETMRERTQAAKDMEAINEARRLEAENRLREQAAKNAATADSDTSPRSDAAESVEPLSTDKTNIYFLVKADVWGSTEAVEAALQSIPLANHPASVNILSTGVGPLNESDVQLAASVPAGNAVLICFNQPVPPNIGRQAAATGVPIFVDNIIYSVIDEACEFIENLLPPLVTHRVIGEAECANIFDITISKRHTMTIAGCRVRNGTIDVSKRIKVFRGKSREQVYDGTLTTLRSHKRDVRRILEGNECGLSFDKWDRFEVGDVLQCYDPIEERRRLNSSTRG